MSTATIKHDSDVFLKSVQYEYNTKISTLTPTTLHLHSSIGTYDGGYEAAVAILCYVKDINVEQYFVNRNGPISNTITIEKDAVVVLVCGAGPSSSAYISVNGSKKLILINMMIKSMVPVIIVL